MSGYVYTFGETMGLFRATELGGLETVTDAKIGIGGADSNVAIGLARLGADAHWTGRVGADGLGRRVVRELRAEGVAVHPIVDEDAPTGLMLKEKRTADTTRVTFYRSGSAGSRLNPGDLDERAIAEASILHITGITASLSETAERAVFAAIDVARNAGVTVAFDVNHRKALWRTGDPGLLYRRIAILSDVVFAGEEEARLIVPRSDFRETDLAASISDLGPGEVIVKLGERGSAGIVDGATFLRGAFRVRVVDSVGAGDAFVAGYLAARLGAADVEERLELASAAGAFACLGPGDWESLPRRDDIRLLHDLEPVQR